MELGWGEVDTDSGHEIMDAMEDNFDSSPIEPGFEVDSFDDFDMGDLGDDF